MEKALRNKFISISMSVVFVVLLIISIILNAFTFLQLDQKGQSILSILSENDGVFPQYFERMPQHMTQETPYTTRYFTLKIDNDNTLLSVDTRNIQSVKTANAIDFAEQILDNNDFSGFIDSYKYEVIEKDYGKLFIFIDLTQDLSMFRTFLISSLIICSVALLCIFILIVSLSKYAIKPIVDSYKKQQQFITNISHELKTPLSIIKVNTEVIEYDHNSSEWTQSIHSQIDRLNDLVNYLVSLSKLDEDGKKNLKVDFSLSDALTETINSFELLANSNNKTIFSQIVPNITYHGDEQSIDLLVSILLENAIKYGLENSTISIEMSKYKNKIKIQMTNFASNLKVGNYDMLFERFYRLDDSRNSETGGFGIGLAIANTIVKNHGGDIKAYSKDGKSIVFSIII